MNGLLLVDKPAGITSHDVVDRIRKAARLRRVGHTGTLDPAATGLLVLCLGKATRLSEHLTGLDKVYEGVMRLGYVTLSHDLDADILEEHPVPDVDINHIQNICNEFVGDIEQIPPMVSAVRVGGERLYKRARKGESVERPPRAISVREFKVLSYEPPDASVRVDCSSGTYVRTLCHDVGQRLGCGAALAALRRTHVGPHDVADALPVDDFKEPADVEARLLSMDKALPLPEVVVKSSSRSVVSTGGTLAPPDLEEPCPVNEGWIQVKSGAGQLLALGLAESSAMGVVVHPKRVFV